jgi:ABC-type transport system involved in Fe-S cluster assembly fused permease/ATPase subunit
VLDNGRVAEIGNHKSLVGANGCYAHLLASAMGGV